MPPNIVPLIGLGIHPFVPSYVQQRMGVADPLFPYHWNAGLGQTHHAYHPSSSDKSDGFGQPVSEMMALVIRKLLGTSMTHQRHVKRTVGDKRHACSPISRVVVFWVAWAALSLFFWGGRRDVTSCLAIQLLYLSGHPFHLTNRRSFCRLSTFSIRNTSDTWTFCKSSS